jgi:hypothetical protein
MFSMGVSSGEYGGKGWSGPARTGALSASICASFNAAGHPVLKREFRSSTPIVIAVHPVEPRRLLAL